MRNAFFKDSFHFEKQKKSFKVQYFIFISALYVYW